MPTKVWHALGLDAGVGRAADALSSQMSLDGASRSAVQGRLTVRLSRPVRPTHFSVEHLHAALCDPAKNANCSSAPQQMEVVGRSGDGTWSSSARLVTRRRRTRPTVQTFAAASLGERVDAVALRVKSNHGHPDYRRLYRRARGRVKFVCFFLLSRWRGRHSLPFPVSRAFLGVSGRVTELVWPGAGCRWPYALATPKTLAL